MSRQFKGEIIREMLWKCATITTEQEFEAAMEELRGINEGAYKYLKAIPPKHWSRAYFSGRAHCDILLNNICESFNSRLVEGREKPIISCLEYIREYLMKRIVIVQKGQSKQKGPLTPTATELFEAIKYAANRCTAIWNGSDKFQVKDSYTDQCVVDIREKTCSCRKWQLTGMPCKHAVCSLWNARENSVEVGIVEDWVHPCYRLDTWKDVYGFKVEPVTGSSSWPKSSCPSILLPPVHKTQVGRPKKQRKKSAMEIQERKVVRNGKLTRAGKTVTCSKCNNKGHNGRSCKGQKDSQAQSQTQSQSRKGLKRKAVDASNPGGVGKRPRKVVAASEGTSQGASQRGSQRTSQRKSQRASQAASQQ